MKLFVFISSLWAFPLLVFKYLHTGILSFYISCVVIDWTMTLSITNSKPVSVCTRILAQDISVCCLSGKANQCRFTFMLILTSVLIPYLSAPFLPVL